MFVTRKARSKFPAGQVLAVARPGYRPGPPTNFFQILRGPVRRYDDSLVVPDGVVFTPIMVTKKERFCPPILRVLDLLILLDNFF